MLLFINTNLIWNYTTLFKKTKEILKDFHQTVFCSYFFLQQFGHLHSGYSFSFTYSRKFSSALRKSLHRMARIQGNASWAKKQHTAEAFLYSLNQEKFKYYQATHVRELIPHTLLSSKLGSVKLYNRGEKKGILYCKLLPLQHLEASRSCTEILQPARLQKGL